LGEGTNSSAFDMNNAGWVAGSSNLTLGGPQHAFLWYGGVAAWVLGMPLDRLLCDNRNWHCEKG
jgi:hypothetical protein